MPLQLFAATDSRFVVALHEEGVSALNIRQATRLALPVLWAKVVPAESLDKSKSWPVATSLVRHFKTTSSGANVAFNPNQVRKFLAKRGVKMIRQQPYWDLAVYVAGFTEQDDELAKDLLNTAYEMSDTYGFKLGTNGRKLMLTFSPVADVYGELQLHVDVQGDFSAKLLQQTGIAMQGYTGYKLQDFLKKILLNIRDAYQDDFKFDTVSNTVVLRIEAEHALASQVMLEQALLKLAVVESIVP
ncbi:MAG: hypothetical protein Q9N02_10955, partial [Ghiorsea sp.]|nr:hypothetical protein [Ghiorsea sp.]